VNAIAPRSLPIFSTPSHMQRRAPSRRADEPFYRRTCQFRLSHRLISLKNFCGLAGVEAVALSRQLNKFIQGKGHIRPIEPQSVLRALPSPHKHSGAGVAPCILNECRLAASRRHGQSKRLSRASLCATTTGRRLPSCIARMSRADEPPASYSRATRPGANIAKLPGFLKRPQY
jgi:hypothetical protein